MLPELALFDILTNPKPKLSRKEEDQVEDAFGNAQERKARPRLARETAGACCGTQDD